jgi:gamma-glutamyltranspeptidase/glutathione hydrolase
MSAKTHSVRLGGLLGAIASLLLAGAVRAAPPPPTLDREAFARHAMVASANPLASAAGLKVLKAGGSAADAAVAVQAVLGLVEPQSSGLGGGAFMLYYDAKTKKTVVYDGRETAPAGATPDMFLGPDGKPLSHLTGILSGRSTGALGAIPALAEAQKEHGRLPWSALFGDAERLAKEGFLMSPRMANSATFFLKALKAPDVTAAFTRPDGQPYVAGDLFKNPAYARTIRRLANDGPRALLEGPIAAHIVAKVHEDPLPGTLTEADLRAFKPTKDVPICRPYRAFVICGPPPPGSGVGVLEILGLLENTDIGSRGPDDPQAWVEFVEASRLAYADRDQYVGDPKFVAVPTMGLIDKTYDASRAAVLETMGRASGTPPFGTPPGATAMGADRTHEPGGTSDFAIVDAEGNVVSITTTVESVFGSGRMVDGFFLNNQLTDFSFSPTTETGAPAANAAAAGKRPRSSMSPVIVFERRPDGGQGEFVMALGSPGGNSIVAYVAKALIGLLDWKLSPEAAFALPNLVARGASVSVEKGADPKIVAALRAAGLSVQTDQGEVSGLHAVVRVPGGYLGGADPRREGVALGY